MRPHPNVKVIDIDDPAGRDPRELGRRMRVAGWMALVVLVPLAVYVPGAVVAAGLVALAAGLAQGLRSQHAGHG